MRQIGAASGPVKACCKRILANISGDGTDGSGCVAQGASRICFPRLKR